MKKLLTLLIFIMCSTLNFFVVGATKTPVINPDNSVSFNLYAPEADEVTLKGTFIPSKEYLKTDVGTLSKSGKIKMEKKGDYWTYTTDILPSEFYTYILRSMKRRSMTPIIPIRLGILQIP